MRGRERGKEEGREGEREKKIKYIGAQTIAKILYIHIHCTKSRTLNFNKINIFLSVQDLVLYT